MKHALLKPRAWMLSPAHRVLRRRLVATVGLLQLALLSGQVSSCSSTVSTIEANDGGVVPADAGVDASTPSEKVASVSPLLNSDGTIDAARTIAALKAINANAIVLESGHDLQWDNFKAFLPEADAAGIGAYLQLPDARTYGTGECGLCTDWRCNIPKPFCRDYVAWVKSLASLSLEHPALRGVFIDDFECGAFCGPTPGFTVDYVKNVINAKNEVNPAFKLIIGVYLQGALADFEITQATQCQHGDTLSLHAMIEHPGPVKNARLELTSAGNSTEWYEEQLFAGDQQILARATEDNFKSTSIDLAGFDLSSLDLSYKLAKNGWVVYLDRFIRLRLTIDGQEVPLTWEITGPECYRVQPYFDFMKQYYDLVDGIVWYSNAFDLQQPETSLMESLLTEATRRLPGKAHFGHFYGAEPWKSPVFPGDAYFTDFSARTLQLVGKANAWFPALLPYYVDYSNSTYAQAANDRPASYDYRFRYPRSSSYELGFFQGIEAVLALPDSLSSLSIAFNETDDQKEATGKWLKELVVDGGSWSENDACSSDKTCLWWTQAGTAWWEATGRNNVDAQIVRDLTSLVSGGKTARILVRLRSDTFKNAGSAPPAVNLYLKTPVLTVNGAATPVTWRYVAGNAMESVWLGPSEKIRQLFSTW